MPNSLQLEKFYGRVLPETPDEPLKGKLIVIEGADGSGRSTQIKLLSQWLESKGYSVKLMGIKRSSLAAEHLSIAQQSNRLTHTTMTLFYATDFYDQLVTQILPSLSASSIVLADRYIYTLMARARVRGANEEWLRNLYSPAVVPDGIFYFKTDPSSLIVRNLNKTRSLDYWESGMDLGLSDDMFDSFIEYQTLMAGHYDQMAKKHNFQVIDSERPVFSIQKELRQKVSRILKPAKS